MQNLIEEINCVYINNWKYINYINSTIDYSPNYSEVLPCATQKLTEKETFVAVYVYFLN